LKDCKLADDFCVSTSDARFATSRLNPFDIRTPLETKETYPPNDFELYLAKPEIKVAIGCTKKLCQMFG